MQQHPIPQNVSQYEFHLIGNMTIKQFLEMGAGVGVAVIFYALPLPGFLKWPLIVLSFLIGAALAFLPFDGRPLDRMVIVFFKAVYSPTRYIWRKSPQIPAFLTFTPRKDKPQSQTELDRLRVRKNLSEYLRTLPGEEAESEYTDQEHQYIQSLSSYFQDGASSADTTTEGNTISQPASASVRVRRLKKPKDIHTNQEDLNKTLQAASMKIPETRPTNAPQQGASLAPVAPQTEASQPQSNTRAQYEQVSSTQAIQRNDLPFPKPPTTPNTLVGMVIDNQGKIVENAIIEVRDENQMPIRALKSNKLGQFFSATQLANGSYQIQVEKNGLNFDVFSIKLNGKIVNPVEIRAKN